MNSLTWNDLDWLRRCVSIVRWLASERWAWTICWLVSRLSINSVNAFTINMFNQQSASSIIEQLSVESRPNFFRMVGSIYRSIEWEYSYLVIVSSGAIECRTERSVRYHWTSNARWPCYSQWSSSNNHDRLPSKCVIFSLPFRFSFSAIPSVSFVILNVTKAFDRCTTVVFPPWNPS